MGRRMDLDSQQKEAIKLKIVEFLRSHLAVQSVLKRVEITRTTFSRWRKEDPIFDRECITASKESRTIACEGLENKAVELGLGGNMVAIKFVLEHSDPRYMKPNTSDFSYGVRPSNESKEVYLKEKDKNDLFTPEQLKTISESSHEDIDRLVRFSCSSEHNFETFKQEILRATGEVYPEFFFRYFLGHWQMGSDGKVVPTAEFHKELFAIQESGNSVCVIPRGHAKTTRGKMRLIWLICYQKVEDFLIWSSEEMVKNIIDSIRQEFEENQALSDCFGLLVPDGTKEERRKRWSQKKLMFTNGVTIHGISKRANVRGLRPDEIWVDDPQENKDVENPEIANKFLHHFRTSLLPTLKPETGKINVTGTNVGEHCLVKRLMEDDNNTFKKIEYTAILDFELKDTKGVSLPQGKKLLWPERYTLKHLQNMFRDMGKDAWLQEMQNVPAMLNSNSVFSENIVFDVIEPTWESNGIQFFGKLDQNGKPVIETDLIFGIDLAEGGINGDFSTIVGMNRQGKLVCQYRGKIEQPLLVAKLKSIFDLGFRGTLMPEKNTGLAFIETIKNDPFLKQFLFSMKNPEKRGKAESSRTYGWHTNTNTKHKMISDYQFYLSYTSEQLQGIDAVDFADGIKKIHIEVSHDIRSEIQQYYYDEKGRANARPGYHDDLLIAHMIACQGVKYRHGSQEISTSAKLNL